jgi:putative membrane protein
MIAAHVHPEIVLGLAALVTAYLAGLRRLGRPAAARDLVPFLGGTLVLALAVLGPLAEWAEHAALSAHMLQHLLLTLVVPPLWLAGTPPALLAPLARRPALRAAGYALTRPAAALAVSGGALVAWHLPAAYEGALRHPALHALEHLTLLGTGLLAWWPLGGRLAAWPRPAPPARLLYLLLCTVPMTAVAAPITLADGILYPYYADAGAGWPLSARADQELAGVLMWLGGTLAYLVAGTVVFFRWASTEEPAEVGPAAAAGTG